MCNADNINLTSYDHLTVNSESYANLINMFIRNQIIKKRKTYYFYLFRPLCQIRTHYDKDDIRLRSRWNWISQCQRVHRESDLIVPFLVPSRDSAS